MRCLSNVYAYIPMIARFMACDGVQILPILADTEITYVIVTG